MKPTRPLVLLALFLGSGLISFFATQLWESRGTPPGVPTLAPVVLLLLAVVALATGLSLRARFTAQRERRPGAKAVDPLAAARAVVFAKASSLVAALVAGIYGGYGLYLARDWDVEARRAQAVRCAWSVGGAVLLIAAALFLERVCRIPDDKDEERERRERDSRR